MLICGANGAGKTVLINYLATGEFRETVSSTEDNLMRVEFAGDRISIRDVPGHFHLRNWLIKAAQSSKAIVLLVDSRDWEKFTEAGWILFDLLNDVSINEWETPIIIACNK